MKLNQLLLLFIILSCHKDPAIRPPELFDVFLIAGQSNTENGYPIDSMIDKNDNGILQLGRFGTDNNQLIPATDPLQHWDPRANRNGFGLSFAKLYQDSLLVKGHKVLLIPCGKGNSGFMDNQWNKGDICYEDAISRVKSILKKYPGSRLKAILWQQGERDILLKNPDYEKNLNSFIENLFNDLQGNEKSFVFIAGGMVPYWVSLNPERAKFQKIIENVSLLYKRAGYASPYLPFEISKPDNNTDTIHYDGNGQRELAKRYFKTYCNLNP